MVSANEEVAQRFRKLRGLLDQMPSGWARDLQIPSGLDNAVGDALHALVAALPTGVEMADYGGLDPRQRSALSAFAIRMATAAVRDNSHDAIRAGVRAIALAGHADSYDPRDETVTFSVLSDAIHRVGADASWLATDAARFVGPGAKEQLMRLRSFISRWGYRFLLGPRGVAQLKDTPQGKSYILPDSGWTRDAALAAIEQAHRDAKRGDKDDR